MKGWALAIAFILATVGTAAAQPEVIGGGGTGSGTPTGCTNTNGNPLQCPSFQSTGANGAFNSTNIATPATPAAGTTNEYSDSTQKAFCYQNDSGITVCSQNPSTMAVIKDEFIGGTTSSGNIGELGWNFVTGGGNVAAGTQQAAGSPGVLEFDTGGAAQANTFTACSDVTVSALVFQQGGAQRVVDASEFFRIRLRLNTVTNDANNGVVIGLTDAPGVNLDAGGVGHNCKLIAIEKKNTGSTWVGAVRSTTTPTETASLGNTTTNSFVWVEVARVDSTTIGFRTASTLAGLVTASIVCLTSAGSVPAACGSGTANVTTIPTGGLSPFIQNWNNNTASTKTIALDYYELTIFNLAR